MSESKRILSPHVIVVIVAAGSGSRFGGDLPKQFCPICGRPVLMTTISRFGMALPNSEIIVVLSDNMSGKWHQLCAEHSFSVPHTVVGGGATRFDSVNNALNYLRGRGKGIFDNDILLVHDGARPNVSKALIRRAVESLADNDAAIPVVAVIDSLRMKNNDGATSVADRSLFVAVQTPQAFRVKTIFDAYTKADRAASFTDDASVVEASGVRIGTFEGDYRNIKITNPADIAVAELFSVMIDGEEGLTDIPNQ